jgi:hypothetical protein
MSHQSFRDFQSFLSRASINYSIEQSFSFPIGCIHIISCVNQRLQSRNREIIIRDCSIGSLYTHFLCASQREQNLCIKEFTIPIRHFWELIWPGIGASDPWPNWSNSRQSKRPLTDMLCRFNIQPHRYQSLRAAFAPAFFQNQFFWSPIGASRQWGTLSE